MSDQENETLSLMDELSAAWEEHENAEISEDEAVEPAGEPQEANQLTESGAGISNELAEPGGDSQDAGPEAAQSAEVQQREEPAVDAAPKGLSPGMRENWKNLDDQTKAEFKRYEERIGGMAQKYANDARRAQAMDKVLQPYNQLFQMNGGVQNILPGLLQTGATLQQGNEVERARTVAALINQFKVNPAQVADFLKGNQAKPSQESQFEDAINQRLAPIQQQLARYQQRDQQMQRQGQKQLADEVAQFAQNPSNDFYNDVREHMADIMDVAASQGRQMGLQEAYDAACWQNPEIRKVLQARQSQGQVQSRKRAASSIHGTPSGEGSTAAPNDLRGALEQAWQNSNRM